MTHPTDEGVRALTEGWMSRDPPPLQHVNLGLCALTGAIANPLLRLLGSKRLPDLETLNVSRNAGLDESSKDSLFGAFPEVVEI
mmetsp:Transcript_40539/g.79925  ORF Transcript_40539/g.79925 Transcript_40539/m.79925 type:complete len:84 (+) Transcript_40539:426-677(+)